MSYILTDAEIEALLQDPKPLTKAKRDTLVRVTKLDRIRRPTGKVKVVSGTNRKYLVKSSEGAPRKFGVSVWYLPKPGIRIPLLRLDCHPGRHPNFIERSNRSGIQLVPPDTPHVHILTERYLVHGFEKALGYAEPNDGFDSLTSAIDYLSYRFGFYDPDEPYNTRYPLSQNW